MKGKLAGAVTLLGLLLLAYWLIWDPGEVMVTDNPMEMQEKASVSAEGSQEAVTEGAGAEDAPERTARQLDGIWKIAAEMVEEDPLMGVVYFEECLQRGEFVEARSFLRALSHRWAAVDPASLAIWIGELPPVYRSEAMTGLISVGTRDQPRTVGNWILSLEDGPQRTRAVFLFVQYMRGHPEQSYLVEWTWRLAAQSEDPGSYMSAIGPVLSQTDPVWMYDFIGTLPDSDTRDRCLESFVSVVSKEEPGRTLAWTQTFEDADLRHELETLSLRALAESAPEEAARWIMEHSDSPHLGERVGHLFGIWSQIDPEAAKRFLHQTPINPDMKEYFLLLMQP